MRTTLFGLALLGAAASAPALAQTSPAAPDRNPPSATMQNSTNPAAPAPAPMVDRPAGTTDRANTAAGQAAGAAAGTAADRSGATTVGPSTEGGQSAVRVDEGTRTAATPQPGANSFTEGQARSRMEAAGFSNVTELQKDDQGIWRGRGTRNGQQTSVALDFTGAVTSR
jgi:hypothetical protein